MRDSGNRIKIDRTKNDFWNFVFPGKSEFSKNALKKKSSLNQKQNEGLCGSQKRAKIGRFFEVFLHFQNPGARLAFGHRSEPKDKPYALARLAGAPASPGGSPYGTLR